MIVYGCISQLRFHRRKGRALGTTKRLDDLVHLLQHPRAPLVAHQPLDCRFLAGLGLRVPGAVVPGLAQAEDMAQDLGPDALLGAQARNGTQAGGDAADVDASQAFRVAEERAVLAADDEDGQVRVGVGELVLELVGQRPVDGVPQRPAPGIDRVDVGLGRQTRRARVERRRNRRRQLGTEGIEHVDGTGDLASAVSRVFAVPLGRLRRRDALR